MTTRRTDPAAPIRPRPFGPPGQQPGCPHRGDQLFTRHHPSAASIHPRKPIPAVARTMSGRSATHRRVSSLRARSASTGMMRMTEAKLPVPPRRSSAAPNSARAHAAVIPTVKPVSRTHLGGRRHTGHRLRGIGAASWRTVSSSRKHRRDLGFSPRATPRGGSCPAALTSAVADMCEERNSGVTARTRCAVRLG